MSIFIYPYSKAANSNLYSKLLYDALSKMPNTVVQQKKLFQIFFSYFFNLSSKHVVHIHWENSFYGSRYKIYGFIKLFHNIFFLLLLKICGVKICWTMHNMFNHNGQNIYDKIVRKFMKFISNAIIIQQKSFYDLQKNNKNIYHYIPHGNYINAYGGIIEKRQDNKIILLSFGAIRPYKKLENIISVMKVAKDDNLELRIIGHGDDVYINKLRSLTDNDARIIMENRFIPDNEVPMIMSHADFSVFWYDESVLTSGAIMLSLSYGVPVISRNIFASDILHDGMNGIFYENENDLLNIFKNLKIKNTFKREAVIDSVKDYSWDYVAKLTHDVYKSI